MDISLMLNLQKIFAKNYILMSPNKKKKRKKEKKN